MTRTDADPVPGLTVWLYSIYKIIRYKIIRSHSNWVWQNFLAYSTRWP